MTVCITSTGDTLDHQVDPYFGRSKYFIFADTETLEYEAVPNPNLLSILEKNTGGAWQHFYVRRI